MATSNGAFIVELKLNPDAEDDKARGRIVVGRDNSLVVSIKPGDAGSVNRVSFTLEIPFGDSARNGATFLVTKTETVNVTATSAGWRMQPLSDDSGNRVWKTRSAGDLDSNGLSVEISGFHAYAGAGTATIEVSASNGLDWSALQRIPVVSGETDYFDVSPDFVLNGGQKVAVFWCQRQWDDPALYKNSVLVDRAEYKAVGKNEFVYEDRPLFTTVYRLEADRGHAGGTTPRLFAPLTRIVQVAQTGWNQQPLPQGSPILLVAGKDHFGADALYGIFTDLTDPKRTPRLYSSRTGFSDWNPVNVEIPREMAYSPGVWYAGKLWLIGGNIMTRQPSSDVYAYDPEENKFTRHSGSDKPLPPRMGHSCVVFDDRKNGPRVFVLGGIDPNQKLLNDVWTWEAKSKWDKVEQTDPPDKHWAGRCMFAAAATASSAELGNKLWIYGGATGLFKAKGGYSDLWSSADGATWNLEAGIGVAAGDPSPLGAALLYLPQSDRLLVAGSFLNKTVVSAHIFRRSPRYQAWEDNPVSWGWEQFAGTAYWLRSVTFNNLWFFWAIQSDMSKPATKMNTKMNIFIP